MRTTIIRSLLLAAAILAASAASSAQISISVNFGPPALPVYQQPPCPGEDYIWTPGYWAWDPEAGYYWVPGTWVLAPEPGLLWTPGYWAFDDGAYYWHAGYWGPTVGYYGGIDYGFGYTGAGYYGGYWKNRRFFYNRAVTNVDVVHIHNVYRTAPPRSPAASRVSFNGGPGGTRARPTAEQETVAHERHVGATPAQTEHQHAASQNRQLFASTNHGRPPVAATAKPAAFSGKGVVAASRAGAPYHPPAKPAASSAPGGNAPAPAIRPNNAARSSAELGHAAPSKSPQARQTTPPAEHAARQPEKPVRPENAPRTQAAPPPSASKRQVAPPAGRTAPQPERQVRPENQSRAQAVPPPKRKAAPPERAPQTRAEKGPAPKPEARPGEPKAPPKEEKEPPKQEPPR